MGIWNGLSEEVIVPCTITMFTNPFDKLMDRKGLEGSRPKMQQNGINARRHIEHYGQVEPKG